MHGSMILIIVEGTNKHAMEGRGSWLLISTETRRDETLYMNKKRWTQRLIYRPPNRQHHLGSIRTILGLFIAADPACFNTVWLPGTKWPRAQFLSSRAPTIPFLFYTISSLSLKIENHLSGRPPMQPIPSSSVNHLSVSPTVTR